MTLSPDFERAQRAKVERRLVALAELARRIREANEAEPVRLGAVAAVH